MCVQVQHVYYEIVIHEISKKIDYLEIVYISTHFQLCFEYVVLLFLINLVVISCSYQVIQSEQTELDESGHLYG